MIVVVHQTVGVAQPVKAVNDPAEDLQEGFAVPVFVEDVFPRVAALGHMVQRAVKFYSDRTSYDLAQITQRLANSKKQDLTPFPRLSQPDG